MVSVKDLRELASRLHERAFCYESPGDFRAGVTEMARRLEATLLQCEPPPAEAGASG